MHQPIIEQDSIQEQEISSINVKPNLQMTATEQSDVHMLNNDDSQYIFTSQQNSIIEEDHEKFVFNTNALKESNVEKLDNDGIKNNEGDLSEPQIQS